MFGDILKELNIRHNGLLQVTLIKTTAEISKAVEVLVKFKPFRELFQYYKRNL